MIVMSYGGGGGETLTVSSIGGGGGGEDDPTTSNSSARIDNGRNHEISVKRSKAFVSIKVDNGPLVTRAIPKAWIDSTHFYVAGINLADEVTARGSNKQIGGVTKGLKGCIHDLIINGESVDFESDPIA